MFTKILMIYLVIGVVVAIGDAWGIWMLRKELKSGVPDAEGYVEEFDEKLGEGAAEFYVRQRPWWLSVLAFAAHIVIWPASCYFTWALLSDKNESS